MAGKTQSAQGTVMEKSELHEVGSIKVYRTVVNGKEQLIVKMDGVLASDSDKFNDFDLTAPMTRADGFSASMAPSQMRDPSKIDEKAIIAIDKGNADRLRYAVLARVLCRANPIRTVAGVKDASKKDQVIVALATQMQSAFGR